MVFFSFPDGLRRAALALVLSSLALTAAPRMAVGADLTAAEINSAAFVSTAEDQPRAVMVKAQVMLDRIGFSSGVIDGRPSENFTNALRAFQKQYGLTQSGEVDEATWAKLAPNAVAPAMMEYVISAADARGPFAPDIPDELEKMTTLKRLSYKGPREMLAERFHLDEDLLAELNPDKPFDKHGTAIMVPNVVRMLPKGTVVRLEVDKPKRMVRAFEAGGKLVGVYPASIGSEDKPAPTGTLKITRIIHHPVYYYDPRFNFPGVEASKRLKIAPGPNNPVGAVWMNLNARSFGIHGTAEPQKVGKAGSHGCVRMTNWDAWALAAMVRRGTTVAFIE
jgi:lipoprotein-anchoring transpeptidase ErfK/SrfK